MGLKTKTYFAKKLLINKVRNQYFKSIKAILTDAVELEQPEKDFFEALGIPILIYNPLEHCQIQNISIPERVNS